MAKGRQAGTKNRNYPPLPLVRALEVANVIEHQASGMAVSKLTLAELLDTTPTSSTLRDLVASARFYGLSVGGINAAEFGLTDLGRAAASEEPETLDPALKEAVLNVEPYRVFFETFRGKKVPAARPLREFLVKHAAIDEARVEEVIEYLLSDAQTAGLVRTVKGSDYVDFEASPVLPSEVDGDADEGADEDDAGADHVEPGIPEPKREPSAQTAVTSDLKTNRKVFITHGRNKKIVEQLKELLTFGDFEPVVSVERESVSKPVPDKVLDDMRSCGAAVIHVGVEQKLLDQEGSEVRILNPNVLIEIGAAMMRYDRKFILLVEQGTTLPSNLQGLYEVRYSGEELDYPATMKLLKAFNEFKAKD